MGFRTRLNIRAKCPLYERIVRSKNGNIAGVQCRFLCQDFGFAASTVIRCSNMRETIDMKELLCDEMYESCPYYKAWCMANEGQKDKRKKI